MRGGEIYQKLRASELGLPYGTGKRYTEAGLVSFVLASSAPVYSPVIQANRFTTEELASIREAVIKDIRDFLSNLTRQKRIPPPENY